MSDPTLVVNRWRRYGKDRLYVSLPDESKVGWWDLTVDVGHPEAPEDLAALTTAVERWKAENPEFAAVDTSVTVTATEPSRVDTSLQPSGALEPPAAPPAVDPDPLQVPTMARPWIDLATNRAGAEAREQALAAKDAAPIRTLFARARGVHTHERAWRIGADGEEKVAARLEKVAKKDPRWRFIHAIPVGTRGSDIDHLIIGPGGVFTANAKHHPGAKIWVGGTTFLVNGSRQPYVRNARHEAARAAELLSAGCGFPVHVEGLIVTVNADDIVVKSQPDGVSVVPRMQITKWLLRHGEILTQTTIERIFEIARRSTTWRP